jgi:hypothetical protein
MEEYLTNLHFTQLTWNRHLFTVSTVKQHLCTEISPLFPQGKITPLILLFKIWETLLSEKLYFINIKHFRYLISSSCYAIWTGKWLQTFYGISVPPSLGTTSFLIGLIWPWIWGHYDPPKRKKRVACQHYLESQNTWLYIKFPAHICFVLFYDDYFLWWLSIFLYSYLCFQSISSIVYCRNYLN